MPLCFCNTSRSVFLWLATLLCLWSTNVEALEYTDAVGRVISLSAPPQRIVSLVPSVTEILYAIDADKQLVGVTDFCNYPAKAQQKTSVGAYDNPGLETVASLSPDLILMDVSSSSPALLRQFEQLQVPVYLVAPKSLESTLTTILSLGEVTGNTRTAQALVDQLNKQIEGVIQMRSDTSVRTLVCVMINPLVVAGSGTLADDLIRYAGGVNVASDLSRYPTVSMETVLNYDPDLIVVSPHPGTKNPAHFFSQWPQLHAVVHRHVVDIEADLLQRPGPRLVAGLQTLAQCYLRMSQESTVAVKHDSLNRGSRFD